MRNFKTVTLTAMGLFIGFVSSCKGKEGSAGPAGAAGSVGAGGTLPLTIACTTSGDYGILTTSFTNNTNSTLSVAGICTDSNDGAYALPATTVLVGATYNSINPCFTITLPGLDCDNYPPVSCILTAVSPSGGTYTGAVTQTSACGTASPD